jgi:nucleoside phosphorylase
MQNKIKHICFIIAMAGEARPLIEHYGLEPVTTIWPDFTPMSAYQKNYRHGKITLIINGHDERYDIDNIGTQAATLASYLAIQYFRPDLLINAGAAGGFRERGMEIGDILLAQGNAYFHDRRIPIPKFREYGIGAYPLMDHTILAKALSLKTGTVSTGNSFDFIGPDKKLMDELKISAKDMEAAAIAWVCDLAGVPVMIVKGITDIVGIEHPSETQFISNFKSTMETLKTKCIEIVDHLFD